MAQAVYRRLTGRGTTVSRRSRLDVETLETRHVRATLMNATTLTYQDVNGDNVSVVFSKPVLNQANLATIFSFDTGNFLNNNTKQQLEKIDLQFISAVVGANITITANKSATNGGDGFANVGEISALNKDLGNVTVDGDLGRIICGDATTNTTGLMGLTVQSIGRFGTSTGAADLNSNVTGRLNKLTVFGDIKFAQITVSGGLDGDLGTTTIGSLIGGPTSNSGSIFVQGDAGAITVKGDLIGTNLDSTGSIIVSGAMTSLQVNGSIKGGGGQFSAQVQVEGLLGSVNVFGSVVGAGGEQSARIASNTKISTVTFGGSLLGGGGKDSGQVFGKILGNVTIGGSVVGGVGDGSGKLESDGAIGNVTIGGPCSAASASAPAIDAFNGLGLVTIKGDVIAGDVSNFSGEISGGNGSIAGVTINGSLIGGLNGGGRITSNKNIGNVFIGGSVVGKGDSSGAVFNANDGTMGNVTINGSLVGGAGNGAGTIFSAGNMGAVKIGGSVLGGPGLRSGSIASNAAMGDVTIGGSLKGGTEEDTGRVEADGNIGMVKFGGDVVGGGGLNSGAVLGNAAVKSFNIGGSVLGGADDDSGKLFSHLDVTGPITIKGNLIAGAGGNTGLLLVDGNALSINIGGSLLGTGGTNGAPCLRRRQPRHRHDWRQHRRRLRLQRHLFRHRHRQHLHPQRRLQGGGDFSARVFLSGNVGTLTINGSLIGGSASGTDSRTQSGFVGVGRAEPDHRRFRHRRRRQHLGRVHQQRRHPPPTTSAPCSSRAA